MQPSVMQESEEKTDKCATEFSDSNITFFFSKTYVYYIGLKYFPWSLETQKEFIFKR